MYQLLIGLGIFASVLLVLVILAQNSKGGGLSSQFGGSGASNIMGVKKTGDLLELLTWVFIVVIIVVSLGVNTFTVGRATNDTFQEKLGGSTTAPAVPPMPKQ